MRRLELDLDPGTYAVARLDAAADLPAWLPTEAFCSVTRSAQELSIVCSESCVPGTVTAERGLRALRVRGPLAFSETGILARLAEPLAAAGISLFVVSTFDTDYLFVAAASLSDAIDVLSEDGNAVYGSA